MFREPISLHVRVGRACRGSHRRRIHDRRGDVGEIGDSFLPFAAFRQPSRCFSAQEHAKEKDTARDKLKSKGNHPVMSEQALKSGIPLLIVAGKIAVDTIWDPEAKDLFN